MKIQSTSTHDIFMKIELTSFTDYFRMNHFEIKHYSEIMQEHVYKKMRGNGKKEANLFSVDQLYQFRKHYFETRDIISQLFLY